MQRRNRKHGTEDEQEFRGYLGSSLRERSQITAASEGRLVRSMEKRTRRRPDDLIKYYVTLQKLARLSPLCGLCLSPPLVGLGVTAINRRLFLKMD